MRVEEIPAEIQRWRMQPGDVLFVLVEQAINTEQAKRLRDYLHDAVKQPHVEVVVLGNGLRLQVVNTDALHAVDPDGNRFVWVAGQWLAVGGLVKATTP